MPATTAPAPRTLLARWHGYRHSALSDDLIAAAIVTILLVPQSLAYAMLAGLPPVVGVMASLLPSSPTPPSAPAAASPWGRSRCWR